MSSNEDLTVNEIINREFSDKYKIFAFLIVPILMTLFFIQGFRAYVPGLYIAIFHVVFQDPGWIASLFALLTIIILILPAFTNAFCDHLGEQKTFMLSIIMICAARLTMAFHLFSIIETVLSALIISFFGVFITIFIKNLLKSGKITNNKTKISMVTTIIISGFLIDSALLTIGISSDISLVTIHIVPSFWFVTQYLWLVVQAPLSALIIYYSRTTHGIIFEDSKLEEKEQPVAEKNNLWPLISLGIGMFLFLAFNLFLYSSAIVEFTTTNFAQQVSYDIINPILIGSMTFALVYVLFNKQKIIFNKIVIIVLNAIITVAMVLFLFIAGRLPYSCYSIAILMTVSVAFMFINFHVLLTNISLKSTKYVKVKSISNIFTAGLLFYILFSFLYDFTTDHAFTISTFKSLGPLLMLTCGLIFVGVSIVAIIQIDKINGGGSKK